MGMVFLGAGRKSGLVGALTLNIVHIGEGEEGKSQEGLNDTLEANMVFLSHGWYIDCVFAEIIY